MNSGRCRYHRRKTEEKMRSRTMYHSEQQIGRTLRSRRMQNDTPLLLREILFIHGDSCLRGTVLQILNFEMDPLERGG